MTISANPLLHIFQKSNFSFFQILVLLWFLGCSQSSLWAQLGGRSSFSFLNMPLHTRTTALGGVNVSSQDSEVGVLLHNPALLSKEVANQFALNYYGFQGGINQTTLVYAHNSNKIGLWGVSLQYLNYGKIAGFDALGNPTNDFSAADFALSVHKSHQIDNYQLGATFKWAGSRIDNFSAGGFFLDIAGTLLHPEKDLKVGLVLKNIGFLYQNYTSSSTFTPPFDAQLGVSYKPEKMPVRFSLTLHNFRNNVVYNDPTRNTQLDPNGIEIPVDTRTGDKILRRFVLGAEFILHKNFNLRFGYNFLRRREMIVAARPAMVGFSFGMRLRVRNLDFAYSRSLLHVAGGANQISLTFDAKKLFKKQKVSSQD
ncbi:type IX secretion system protein PorQ [Hugenholtzia roseola]|uniref:type IX secretion system protein PorQ n=1 Tax=Hugenholtzia roseola TaxID=1002 RepID=UPI00041CB4A5|nr:type IX secretion system protein PorQ [Hugenholtzia roseola]